MTTTLEDAEELYEDLVWLVIYQRHREGFDRTVSDALRLMFTYLSHEVQVLELRQQIVDDQHLLMVTQVEIGHPPRPQRMHEQSVGNATSAQCPADRRQRIKHTDTIDQHAHLDTTTYGTFERIGEQDHAMLLEQAIDVSTISVEVPETGSVHIFGMTATQDFFLTLAAPEMLLRPLALEESLLFGATATHTLRIDNSGPEGLVFIKAEDSPNGEPLLVVGNEISGTTTVYQVTY